MSPPTDPKRFKEAVLTAWLRPADAAEPRWVIEASYAPETSGENEAGGDPPSTFFDCTGTHAKTCA